MIVDTEKTQLFLARAEAAGIISEYEKPGFRFRIYTHFGGVLYTSGSPVRLAKIIMLARHYEDTNDSGMHIAIMEKCNYLIDGKPSPLLWDYDSQILRDYPKAQVISLRKWLISELTSQYPTLGKEEKGVAKKFLRWQSGTTNLHF